MMTPFFCWIIGRRYAISYAMMRSDTIKESSILIGAHFSIAGGLHKAIERATDYRCNAVQIFTKNASTWKERHVLKADIHRFRVALKQSDIRCVCSHGAYLINLASPEKRKSHRSIRALRAELIRSASLSIPFVIIHPGAHMGSGMSRGLERIASSVHTVLRALPDNPCRLLLETTAGQGSSVGHTFEQLAFIRKKTGYKNRIGFCFDTSHVFAAGYDLRTRQSYRQTMDDFDRVIGLDALHIMHLNDAKRDLGSRVDRHEHIGEGKIGAACFRFIMNDPRLASVPKILETPKMKGGKDADRLNLNRLRAFVKKPAPTT